MIKIDGYLVNGKANQTRIYDYTEKNLRLSVFLSDDPEYIRNCDFIKKASLYTLIWPEVKNQSRTIYIGQTSNARRRILQHIQKGRDFSDVCVLTRIQGDFEKTETMYLEYLAIIQAIEQGDAKLMQNLSVPKEPYLSADKKILMNDIFRDYMMLVEYAGFNDVFKKRRYVIQNNLSENSKHIKIFEQKDYNDVDMVMEEEIPYEDRIMIKYILRGPDYYAECIKLNDGQYMFLGSTKIAEDVNPKPKISIGTVVKSLDDAAIMVTGGNKAIEWEIDRKII